MAYYYDERVLSGSYDEEADQAAIKTRLRQFGATVDASVTFVGEPRVYLTLMSGQPLEKAAQTQQHSGRIVIGGGSYIDSSFAPAFASTVTKLTSVQRAGRPAGQILIGNNVVLQGACIVAYDKVVLGDQVVCGTMVSIMDCDGHDLVRRGDPDEVNRLDVRPVVIGHSVWIGNHVSIMKGVTVGDHAVIGAHAVVTKDVPANTVVAGNPARVIRQL
ncbi:acyltransferase [Photobacterium sp. TY1-4]|uniref:acyltransferase n=1 Tax=Photobacterium sp. TY1-4 TaxID=2899122 RepID=UPI0021FC2A03|nr:acyltransferase [Photobacterium sp. TY1-4]UXI02942.1 acyltransferase [Photobacterium sp. TY1-4]